MQQTPSTYARRAAAVLSLCSLALSGCATWTIQSGPPQDILTAQPNQVVQVTTTDGSRHALISPYVDGDAIVGFRKVAEPVEGAVLHQRQYRTRFDTLTIPLSRVHSIAVRRTAPVRTGLFLAGALAGVGAVLGSAGATN